MAPDEPAGGGAGEPTVERGAGTQPFPLDAAPEPAWALQADDVLSPDDHLLAGAQAILLKQLETDRDRLLQELRELELEAKNTDADRETAGVMLQRSLEAADKLDKQLDEAQAEQVVAEREAAVDAATEAESNSDWAQRRRRATDNAARTAALRANIADETTRTDAAREELQTLLRAAQARSNGAAAATAAVAAAESAAAAARVKASMQRSVEALAIEQARAHQDTMRAEEELCFNARERLRGASRAAARARAEHARAVGEWRTAVESGKSTTEQLRVMQTSVRESEAELAQLEAEVARAESEAAANAALIAEFRRRGEEARAQAQRDSGALDRAREEASKFEAEAAGAVAAEEKARARLRAAAARVVVAEEVVSQAKAFADGSRAEKQHIFSELANAQNAPNSTMGRMVAELAAIGKTIEINETLAEEEKRRAAESKVETDKLEIEIEALRSETAANDHLLTVWEAEIASAKAAQSDAERGQRRAAERRALLETKAAEAESDRVAGKDLASNPVVRAKELLEAAELSRDETERLASAEELALLSVHEKLAKIQDGRLSVERTIRTFEAQRIKFEQELAKASEAMAQTKKDIETFVERRLRTEATTSAVLGADRPEDELRTLGAESLQGMKEETARALARIEASARTEKEDREKLVAFESEIDALRGEGRDSDGEDGIDAEESEALVAELNRRIADLRAALASAQKRRYAASKDLMAAMAARENAINRVRAAEEAEGHARSSKASTGEAWLRVNQHRRSCTASLAARARAEAETRDLEIECAVLLNRAGELERQMEILKESTEAAEARLRAARILRAELARWTTQLQREARKPRDRGDESWPEAAANEALDALRERALDAESRTDPVADPLALLLEIAARCRGPAAVGTLPPPRSPSEGGAPSPGGASGSGKRGPKSPAENDRSRAGSSGRRRPSRSASAVGSARSAQWRASPAPASTPSLDEYGSAASPSRSGDATEDGHLGEGDTVDGETSGRGADGGVEPRGGMEEGGQDLRRAADRDAEVEPGDVRGPREGAAADDEGDDPEPDREV